MSEQALIACDVAAVLILVFALYFPRHRRRDLVAAYLGVNIGVLAVADALNSTGIGAGLGLGLFGVLSIIRLRSTESGLLYGDRSPRVRLHDARAMQDAAAAAPGYSEAAFYAEHGFALLPHADRRSPALLSKARRAWSTRWLSKITSSPGCRRRSNKRSGRFSSAAKAPMAR